MKLLDRFKETLQKRVDLMLDCAYKVAIEGGYGKDKVTFLAAIRDEMKQESEKGEKNERV